MRAAARGATMRGDAGLVLATLALEACLGYPLWLYARIRHPVVWIGALLRTLERAWNRATFSDTTRRLLGMLAVGVTLGSAIAVGLAIEQLPRDFVALVVTLLIATTGLAQRSLYVHVREVLLALEAQDLTAARTLVANIVGRDTEQLTTAQVAAAALESLAESFNDAVVAPAFWLFSGGLPGLFAFKAANTADSMIGHMEPRWRMFGWAAARLDDGLNLVPARLAGTLLALAARGGFAVMRRDAPKHASPNAGWPEAALAGGLAVRLGGLAYYGGIAYERPTFGDGPLPTALDLRRGLQIYLRACGLLWALLAAIALASC
jgi:adenosylcobinamide-phosphate synthase